MHKLETRTHTNRTWTKVVEENDPEVAFLVGAAGAEITETLARQLGLIETKNASAEIEDKTAVKRKKT